MKPYTLITVDAPEALLTRAHAMQRAEREEVSASASTDWRRSCLRQWREELPLLRRNAATIAACLCVQYIHGMAAQAALYMHQPAPPLHDVGFVLVPAFAHSLWWFSEAVTISLFSLFGLFLCSPFLSAPRFHAVTVLVRVLVVIAICQLLRVCCFTATQLPAPARHCQPGTTARLPWPDAWVDWLVVDVMRQSSHGCGDLIFSSHLTFGLTFALSIRRYASRAAPKIAAFTLVGLQTIGIIASRKHYTVDVVVALFVVPLVWDAMLRRIADAPPPRSGPAILSLLPR